MFSLILEFQLRKAKTLGRFEIDTLESVVCVQVVTRRGDMNGCFGFQFEVFKRFPSP